MRKAEVLRKTLETDIAVELNLDGSGTAKAATGIGFFDHMLAAFARHALFDLTLRCAGDLQVDCHHTIEDCGIALGQAIAKAAGDRAGIARVGHSYVPMDEALAFCAADLSNRGFLACDVQAYAPSVGGYDTQMTKEFFRGLAVNGGITLHVKSDGQNDHHIIEAAFKAAGRALRIALERDPRVVGIPSTKGML